MPADFDYDPETQRRIDRMQRPELTHGVIEFIAPTEYMVRPPQPPAYVFVIDVSYQAVVSGMLAAVSNAILEGLDLMPNREKRTRIAFVTFDSSVHFYNLNPALSQPQMLMVPDLEDVFLPQPDDLLCNLTECKQRAEALLEKLPEMFKSTQNTQSALGSALLAAVKMTSALGGKIVLFQSVLPNKGQGTITSRDDPKILDTPKVVFLVPVAARMVSHRAGATLTPSLSLSLRAIGGMAGGGTHTRHRSPPRWTSATTFTRTWLWNARARTSAWTCSCSRTATWTLPRSVRGVRGVRGVLQRRLWRCSSSWAHSSRWHGARPSNGRFAAAGPRFTSGSVYYYPGFNGAVQEDAVKFAADFEHFISRPFGLEAVIRVRASKGT